MSEEEEAKTSALVFLENVAEILPAGLLSADEVTVLKESAQGQLRQKALIDALGVDPDQLKKDKGLTKAFDKDGNQLFGRGVEKVNLNVRMDKPLIEVLNSYCEATGLTKTDVLRQIIFTHLYSANLARQADLAEGEPTTDAED